MMKQGWMSALVALLLGAASFWLAREYISARATAAEAVLSERYSTVPMVVASTTLAPGTVLGPEHLAARQMPRRYVSSAAIDPARVEMLYGRRTQHTLEAGDLVLEALLAPERDPLAVIVRPGRRAITVPVDELSSFAGMLEPGNLVDLVYSAANSSGTSAGVVSLPILEAVQVIATGRAVRLERRIDSSGEVHESESPYTTVTLDVDPEAAQRVLLAQRAGEVSALLRHPRDGALGLLRPMHSSELTPVRSRASQRPRVEIIVGGVRR